MKLSDLLEAPLDSQNPIDRELAKTSKDIKNDGSLDQDDIDSQMDPMDDNDMAPDGPENTPDGPMGGDTTEPLEEPTKPVDSELMNIVRNTDYVTRYKHDIDKPSHPNNIMSLDMSELSQLRNKIRVKLDQIGVEDSIGMYSNPDIKAAQDMLSFVDTVMAYKKNEVKQSSTQKSSKARYKKQTSPKNIAGKRFKAKKSK